MSFELWLKILSVLWLSGIVFAIERLTNELRKIRELQEKMQSPPQ